MNYGDDVVDGIARHGDDFMERYAKSGDEFVEEFLEKGDEVFAGGTQGGGSIKDILPWGEEDYIAYEMLSQEEKNLYQYVLEQEPFITKDMIDIVSNSGGELAELEERGYIVNKIKTVG